MPFCVGVENLKNGINLGAILRGAHNFGASMVFTVGRPYVREAADTLHSYKHIPVLRFLTWDDYREHAPFDWIPVGIEITEAAEELPNFAHPKRAVYLLGPEDGSISKAALNMCKYVVRIPSKRCLNVAQAAIVVMYDRIAKLGVASEVVPAP